MMDDEDTCLQESPEKKQKWLAEMQQKFPVGSKIKILNSDLEVYIGKKGTVVDYDLGCSGCWPLVQIELDAEGFPATVEDGFYDDEIEAI